MTTYHGRRHFSAGWFLSEFLERRDGLVSTVVRPKQRVTKVDGSQLRPTDSCIRNRGFQSRAFHRQFLNKRNPLLGRGLPSSSRRHSMEDERRKRVSTAGRVEPICTLCELEGRPYVHADDEYVVASTLREKRRSSPCAKTIRKSSSATSCPTES